MANVNARISQIHTFCNMQSNVLNDLAEAKRRWTGKKDSGPPRFDNSAPNQLMSYECETFSHLPLPSAVFETHGKQT